MQKRALRKVVIILAFVTAAALPLIFGMLVHKQQLVLMETWAANHGVKFVETASQFSWKSATSEYQLFYPFVAIPSEIHAFLGAITLKSPQQSTGLELHAQCEWEHGPWFFWKPARGKLKIFLPSALTKEPILLGTVDMTIAWNGSVDGQLEIAQLKLQTQNAEKTLLVGSGTADFNYSPHSSWDAHMVLNSLAYEEYQSPLYQVGTLSLDTQQSYHPAIDWLGSSHFQLHELKLMVNPDPWSLKGLSSKTDIQLIDNQIQINWLASIDSLLLNQGQYGPMQIEVSASHLDPMSWHQVSQTLKNMSRNNTAVENLKELPMLAELISQLLAKQSQVALHNLTIQTPQGGFHLEGTLAMKPLSQTDGANLAQVLQSLQMTMDAKIAKSLAESVLVDYLAQGLKQAHPEWNTEQIQSEAQHNMLIQVQIWRDKKWLLEEDHQYQLNIHLENAVLHLNNEAVGKTTL